MPSVVDFRLIDRRDEDYVHTEIPFTDYWDKKQKGLSYQTEMAVVKSLLRDASNKDEDFGGMEKVLSGIRLYFLKVQNEDCELPLKFYSQEFEARNLQKVWMSLRHLYLHTRKTISQIFCKYSSSRNSEYLNAIF